MLCFEFEFGKPSNSQKSTHPRKENQNEKKWKGWVKLIAVGTNILQLMQADLLKKFEVDEWPKKR